MTTTERPAGPAKAFVAEIVIPIYNEERVLEASVRRLHAYLTRTFPYPFIVTIADNASSDESPSIARALAEEFAEVRVLRLEHKGRGLALRHAWSASEADVVSYMDADLSIDLDGFLPLIAPLVSGHSDLAIGTRHAAGSSVSRSLLRALLSRTYNLLLRIVLGVRFSDAQCGFKAGRREIVQHLMPAVHDDKWFFDTELLYVASRQGLRIHEVPIDCLDDPDSSVDIVRTVTDDLRGILRVLRRVVGNALHVALPDHLCRARLPEGMAHQFIRFVAVGLASGLLHIAFYLAFRTVVPALCANAIGLVLTTVFNTAANRRLTFGIRGRTGALRHQAEGGVAFVLSLGLSSASLLLLQSTDLPVSWGVELAVLFLGDALAAVLRFTLLRHWVFAARRAGARP